MCRATALILFTGCLLFATGSHAQKTAKKAKQKPGLISIYIKKRVVYRFTRPEYQRFRDSINSKTRDALHRVSDHKIEWRPAGIAGSQQVNAELLQPDPEKVNIYENDRLILSLTLNAYRKFRDSVATSTKDTLYAINDQRVEVHPFLHPMTISLKARPFVAVNPKGYVALSIPMAKEKHYRIVFFAGATEIFRIGHVKEEDLVLDKTSFIHAGWFSYELYEDEKLKEKGRLFLPK